MKKFLFYFAVTGWTLGLIVHVLSLAHINVAAKVPFVWLLHVGIFAVFVPAILEMKKNEALKAYQQSAKANRKNPFAVVKIIFNQTPSWLAAIAIAGFIYAFINFLLFMMSQQGSATIQNGQYILHNHGHLIKTLTQQEYNYYKANEVRGFSGHWLAFYGLAAAILFPYQRKATTTSSQPY